MDNIKINMRKYLLIWNPNRYNWEDLPDDVFMTNMYGEFEGRWSTGQNKRIMPGDRIFLLKLGVPPKGII
jgi:5-methylcytosine-specific restriction protein A